MKIYLHRQFKREVKTLAKKYPSLKTDITELISELQINPTMGEPLGKNRYKIRLKITSKGTGKSGGGRVITLLEFVNDELWILSLYDKSDISSVSDAFLDQLVDALEE
jgi:hypothetical protein